jgi:hypothetical protein
MCKSFHIRPVLFSNKRQGFMSQSNHKMPVA